MTVKVFLHFNGANQSTVFTDESGKIWTPHGNAQIVTDQDMLGGACGLFDGVGDYISTPAHADFNFGSGNFIIDLLLKLASAPGAWPSSMALYDQFYTVRACAVYIDNVGLHFAWSTNGSTVAGDVSRSWSPSINIIYRITVGRIGSVVKFFVNRTQLGADIPIGSASIYPSTIPVFIGASHIGDSTADGELNGRLDEYRISDGIVFFEPDAPTNVAASENNSEKVVITWTPSEGATEHRVYRDNVLIATLGAEDDTYDDTGADAPVITPGSAAASDGTSSAHIALSLSGQSIANGTTHTYKVVASNDRGDSPNSATDTGYRPAGSLIYQWQISAADSDASYSDISGGTTASYNYTGSPSGGSGRYFKCKVNATGATQQISTADRGNRMSGAVPEAGTGLYLTWEPQEAKVSHRWRTAIQKVVLGNEKRTALFTWPRLILSNKYTPADSAEINWLKRNLIFNADKIWGVPVWPDKTILTAIAANGQKVLAVGQTDYRHFYAGRSCIIIYASNPFIYAIGVIDSFSAAQITLTENLADTWPAGSLVLPLYACRISGNQSVEGIDMRRQSWDLEATEAFEEQREFVYALPASGAAQYLDIDLFLFPAQKPVTYGFARPYDLQQFLGLGYAWEHYAAGDNDLAMKAQFMIPSRPQIRAAWDFFDAKMGRLEFFWLPSWNRDIVPTLPIGAEDTEIIIEPIEYGTTYLSNDVLGRHVFIRFPDRSYVCRKITAASGVSITLDSAPGKAVPAGQLPQLLISFLYYCRFDLDEMEMSYPKGRPDFGQAELSFAALVGESIE